MTNPVDELRYQFFTELKGITERHQVDVHWLLACEATPQAQMEYDALLRGLVMKGTDLGLTLRDFFEFQVDLLKRLGRQTVALMFCDDGCLKEYLDWTARQTEEMRG